MVCKVCALEHDDVELVVEHVRDRQDGGNRQLFNDFQEEWNQAVQDYIEHKGNPEHISPIGVSVVLKKALKNLWDHPHGRFEDIKAELQAKRKKLAYCPFCGEMGCPGTHDHYLPKEYFAEFAIAHNNLVPMCDICQGKKGTDYLIDERKAFLHPYYDADNVVINLSVGGDFDPVPTFDFEYECDAALRYVIETHVKQLDIKARFFDHLSAMYTGFTMGVKGFCSNKEDKRQSIKEYLEGIKTGAEALNINHWDAIIYRSLLNSEEWLDHMAEQCE